MPQELKNPVTGTSLAPAKVVPTIKGTAKGEVAEDPEKKKEEEDWVTFTKETGKPRGLGSATAFTEWRKKRAVKPPVKVGSPISSTGM